jgi:hypothetical protein
METKDFIIPITLLICGDNSGNSTIKGIRGDCQSGTFTAGALRVHVTQAAISMQIRQLENEIGARVLCAHHDT